MKRNAKSDTAIKNRIARIEGQLKGVRRMIEEKRECLAILRQVVAAREALSMLGAEILKHDLICKNNSRRKISDEYIKTLLRAR